MYTNPGIKYWNITDEIPVRFPLLDRWLQNEAHRKPLRGITMLLIQHQLGNQVPQAIALLELGVAPDDLYWIDIPYTANPEVRDKLISLGIPEQNLMVSDFKLLDDYGSFQLLRVQQFLRKLTSTDIDKLIVLDDGSYALEALSHLKDRPTKISIVEQTTRGIIKIEENLSLATCANQIPLINVARSWPKMNLEPPFIGLSVCEALKRRLEKMPRISPYDRCLVLGYGAIGEQVTKFLNEIQGFPRPSIHIFDPVRTRMDSAIKAGFSTWERGDCRYRFRLVVGCSGRASFRLGDHVLLEDGAYLASATSGTVELSRQEFIEQADSSPYDDIWIDRRNLNQSNVHSDIQFHFVDRDATFINGGFPVNFIGNINCIPPRYIQPTPVMMCAAAVQAARSTLPGLQDLDHSFCKWLTGEFMKELGEESDLINRY